MKIDFREQKWILWQKYNILNNNGQEVFICGKAEMQFLIFLMYQLAEKWHKDKLNREKAV